MGRPTDCTKDIDIKVRVTSEMNDKLEHYSKKNGITKAETIRKAIKKFFGEK